MRCGASLAVMSRTRWSPSSSAHEGLQLAGGLRHVDPDDRRAVAVQDPGDLLADAAARAGHERDLAGQRAGPVGHLVGGHGAVGTDADDLARDVGRLGGEEEGQRRGDRPVGGRSDVHELDGAAAADLLAEGAGEALERALGDPLGPGALLGGRADHDHAGAGLEAAHERGEELLQGDETGGVGDAGGVEDQGLGARALLERGGGRDAQPVEGGREGLRQAALAAEHDEPVHQRRAVGPALEPGGVGQPEVLDEQLADRGGHEALVAVAHGRGVPSSLVGRDGLSMCNACCNSESTFRDVPLRPLAGGDSPARIGTCSPPPARSPSSAATASRSPGPTPSTPASPTRRC